MISASTRAAVFFAFPFTIRLGHRTDRGGEEIRARESNEFSEGLVVGGWLLFEAGDGSLDDGFRRGSELRSRGKVAVTGDLFERRFI